MSSRRYAAWLLPTSSPQYHALAWEDEPGRAAMIVWAMNPLPDYAPIGVRQPWLNMARKAAKQVDLKIKGTMAWLIWLDDDTREAAWLRQEIIDHDFAYEPHPERVYLDAPRGEGRRPGQGRKSMAEQGKIARSETLCIKVEPYLAQHFRGEGGSARLYEAARAYAANLSLERIEP